MPNLIAHSLDVIRRYQQPGGAYPACPVMPDYQFCWFRDGSFIAHAMLLHGEVQSATAFHHWAAQMILRYESGARRAISDVNAGKTPSPHDVLRARYTYDGGKGPDDWPEFQLDGLGTWLWALKAYQAGGNSLNADVCRATELVADYLATLWRLPCHDLWEEHGDSVHPYTLGAIFAGMRAAAEILDRPSLLETAVTIQRLVLAQYIQADGAFSKFAGSTLVDGCMPGLATPYRLIGPDSPEMQATVKRIEADLYARNVGVHRYLGDSYYGGGAWLLLLAWLGWHYADCGDLTQAKAIQEVIEQQASPNGDLAEQIVPPMLAETSYYDYWVRVRGPIAKPLLWSHAMYLILTKHLIEKTAQIQTI